MGLGDNFKTCTTPRYSSVTAIWTGMSPKWLSGKQKTGWEEFYLTVLHRGQLCFCRTFKPLKIIFSMLFFYSVQYYTLITFFFTVFYPCQFYYIKHPLYQSVRLESYVCFQCPYVDIFVQDLSSLSYQIFKGWEIWLIL